MNEVVPGLVSTIIPVRNRPAMLREAVESVLAQTYRPIQIIISDDGSTDDTPRVAQAMAAGHPDVIECVLNPKRGAGPSRETGRLRARGEFIQYLDSDDLLLPGKFAVQVAALRARPECGAAYGYIRYQDMDGSVRPEPFKRSGESHGTLFPLLLNERWWNTDCPLFRRSVCDAVGSWSDLPYSQDWEHDARVGGLGTLLVHCPEFVCVQRHHGNARQTGHGGWLEPRDRERFFFQLYEQAVAAGVPATGPEMRRFARWVFFHARQCALLGDAAASRRCLELAFEAAGAPMLDMRAYRLFARIAGWRTAARVTTSLHMATRDKGSSPRRLEPEAADS